MTPRTEAVAAMTPDERIVALVYLGGHYPVVFDEVMADIEKQRRIRARREAAAEGVAQAWHAGSGKEDGGDG